MVSARCLVEPARRFPDLQAAREWVAAGAHRGGAPVRPIDVPKSEAALTTAPRAESRKLPLLPHRGVTQVSSCDREARLRMVKPHYGQPGKSGCSTLENC